MAKTVCGLALHDHHRERVVYGVSEAVDRLPLVADRWGLEGVERDIFMARARHFEWTAPRGALPEIALCLMEDGTVEVVKGGRGHYPDLPPGAVLPIQIDCFWAEPDPLVLRETTVETDSGPAIVQRVVCPPGSTLFVIDLKTGAEKNVDPVESNAQARGSAVLAAKWTGAKSVMPGIVFWAKGQGIWDQPEAPLDEAGIESVYQEMLGLVASDRGQRERFARGEALDYRTGRHCDWCDAATFCPAKTAVLKRWMGDPNPLATTALTESQLRELAALEPQFGRFHAQVKAVLASAVDASGRSIDIGNGKAWGRYITQKGGPIDPGIALDILTEEVGEEFAEAAIRREVSREAIESAIREAHAEQGIKKQLGRATKRVMAKLIEAGAIQQVVRESMGIHVAPAERPSEQAREPLQLDGIEIDGDD
jgi:hypothetical protein